MLGRIPCPTGRPQFHSVAELTGIRSTAFWSRPFCDTYENGRRTPFLIVAKGLIFRPVWASPALPACEVDHCPFRRNSVEAIPRYVEVQPHHDACRSPALTWSTAVPDGSAAVPLGCGADRNLQHRILVATILRHIRKWAENAFPHCCQRMHLLTGSSFPCAARL